MRTLLICHHDAPLDREGLARWLGSFSTYVGTVVVQEPPGRLRRRIAREIKRVGWARFLDVLAFRAYYAVARAHRDREWADREMQRLRRWFPVRPDAAELVAPSPNDPGAERFIHEQQPDLVIARCKTILKEQVFTIPRLGTFVMLRGSVRIPKRPRMLLGACRGDLNNVGMRCCASIAASIPARSSVFSSELRRGSESHVVLEQRAVLDHLDDIRRLLLDIEARVAPPIDTTGRSSATWGQPWLTADLGMRRTNDRAHVSRHRVTAG